ncbi:MAG: hypothetical protein AB1421_06145 [Pseudomonadota bacterium]
MKLPACLLLATLSWNAWATGVNQGPPVDKNAFIPVLTKTMVEYERMTANEVLSMEPACLVIGMGRATGNHWGIPDGLFPKGAEPKWSDYPMLYVEGSSAYAQWFHHYCWGELDRLRYFAATNPEKKAKYLKKWMGQIGYSLGEAKEKNNRWSYYNKVRGDLAAAQLESKKYSQAATTAAEVIAAAPEIEAPHSTLIDALIALKKKPEAEAAAVEAMKRFGKKKSLVRRYKALTGKEPDIPDPEPATVAAAASPAPAPAETPAPPPEAPAKAAAPDAVPAAQQSVSPPAKIGNETNPYCRFCPDPVPAKP